MGYTPGSTDNFPRGHCFDFAQEISFAHHWECCSACKNSCITSSVALEGYLGFGLETLKEVGVYQAGSVIKDTIELRSQSMIHIKEVKVRMSWPVQHRFLFETVSP